MENENDLVALEPSNDITSEVSELITMLKFKDI